MKSNMMLSFRPFTVVERSACGGAEIGVMKTEIATLVVLCGGEPSPHGGKVLRSSAGGADLRGFSSSRYDNISSRTIEFNFLGSSCQDGTRSFTFSHMEFRRRIHSSPLSLILPSDQIFSRILMLCSPSK